MICSVAALVDLPIRELGQSKNSASIQDFGREHQKHESISAETHGVSFETRWERRLLVSLDG